MVPVAFVTTCKGRLHHVKQTLSTLVAESPAEIILVDYGCPDNTAAWVEQHFPSVKVVRVNDDTGFCLPRARNIGAAHATSPWLCFIDADIQVQQGWLEWMQQHLRDGHFYRASLAEGQQLQEIAGTFLCPREAFLEIGGYDEVFRGWGGEDIDLYARLPDEAGVKHAYYPHDFVRPISHANTERTTFHAIKNISIQGLINGCYVKAKSHLRSHGINQTPLETRQQLMNDISANLQHHERPPATFVIRLQARNLINRAGQVVDLPLEIAKRRRYGFFGARKTIVRVLSRSAKRHQEG